MKSLKTIWQELTIKGKILSFTGFVFFTLLVTIVFNLWIFKFSLIDFGGILETNANTNELVLKLRDESDYFETYMKNGKEETRLQLMQAIKETEKTLEALPTAYWKIGAERYARTQSIRSAYEVYSLARDEMINRSENMENYIQSLYSVYEMQGYLKQYAENLMTLTIEAGNKVYQSKVPVFERWAVFAAILTIGLFAFVVYFSRIMNHSIIEPVLKVVQASKKIADNEFFTEDLEVENQDELGEMVHAFNKMKYATGEYISALEEQSKTLDLLHAEELSKLEMEKQLDVIHLELLKSQIQPHFLFNTLNVIAGMANLEDAETTEKMIKALSNLLRYNLKTPEVEVVLDKELKVLEDYMYLQQMRFGSRVVFELHCEADRELTMVPSFIFQPLAENAIIHGLAPKEDGGSICVNVCEERNEQTDSHFALRIEIVDTGVGMDEEQLVKLRNSLNEETAITQAGIGIRNVYQRIKSLYPDSTFAIESKKGEGTKICIRIAGDKSEQ